MNQKIGSLLRQGCQFARDSGIVLVRGPWCVWTHGKVVAADAIFSTLLRNELISGPPADSSNPGYIKLASELLGVDRFWLHRFSMGWDRNHHVTLVMKEKEDEKEVKDEVSYAGIQLWKEFER